MSKGAVMQRAASRSVLGVFFAVLTSVASADPAALVLKDDFEGGAFAPASGLFYKKNKEQERGAVRFQSDVVRSGASSLELSVEPSCPSSGTECSERAEVWEKPQVLAPYDKPLWYAFSMRLGDPIPQENHRLVMAQWKREILPGAEGNYSPFLALRLNKGRLVATVVSDKATWQPRDARNGPTGCPAGFAPAAKPDDWKQVRATIAADSGLDAVRAELEGCSPNIRLTTRGNDLPMANSGWIDFVFLVKPDPNGKGLIEIAANGKWVATVEGAIGHEGPGLDKTQYFKFGPYRAGRPDRWVIYFDDFRRSPQCLDVAPASLCEEIRRETGRS
jgi:hypothetical protein